MYIAIDMAALQPIYKTTMWQIAVERTFEKFENVHVCPIDSGAIFKSLTLENLHTLVKNITGEVITLARADCIALLRKIFALLPTTNSITALNLKMPVNAIHAAQTPVIQQQQDIIKVVAPSANTNKGIIWNTADEFVQKTKCDKSLPAILALRKEIMQYLLDEFAIPKTTSSNELGRWQKHFLTTN